MANERLNIDIHAQDKTRAAFASAQRSMSGFKSNVLSIKGALGATFAVAGVAALTSFTKKSLEAVDAIGKTADKLGISTDTLQEYRFALDLAGVSQAQVDKGLEQVVARVGELKNETGSLLTFLDKYNESLGDQIRQTRTTDEAIDLLTEAIADETDATQKAALARAAFGRSGVAMVNGVRDGTAAFRESREELREWGGVISEQAIRNAEKAQDELTRLGTFLDVTFKNIVAENAQQIAILARNLLQASIDGAKFFGILDRSPTEKLATMREDMRLLNAQIENYENLLSDPAHIGDRIGREKTLNGLYEDRIRLRGDINALEAEASKPTPLQVRVTPGGVDTSGSPALTDKEQRAVDKEADRQIKETMEAHREWQKVQDEGRRIFEQTRNPIERYNARLDRLNELLAEGAIDQTTFNRAARKAGEELVEQQKALEDAADKLENDYVDAWGIAGDALEDFVRRGKKDLDSFVDVAIAAAIEIARAYQKAEMERQNSQAGSSGGSGGGFFSSIGSFFGSSGSGSNSGSSGGFFGFASGGDHMGGLRLVGEEGPELEKTGPSRIHSAEQTRRILSGAGGGQNITIHIEQHIGTSDSRNSIMSLLPMVIDATTTAVKDGIQRGDEGYTV